MFLLCTLLTNSVYSSVCTQNLGSNVYNCPPRTYPDMEQEECLECPEGYYCPGGHFAFCCNIKTNGEFPKSAEGAKSINECYKSINSGECIEPDGTLNHNCGSFYPNSAIKCWNNDGEYNSTNYHIDTNNAQCYAEYLDCKIFGSSNCPNDKISGSASWFSSEEEWDIDNCRCDELSFADSTDKFCSGIIKNVKYGGPRWLDYVQEISYTGTYGLYYCTQCNTGYYVNHLTDMEDNTDDDDCENHAVCKCTLIPKGKYLEHACTQSLEPPVNNYTQDICPPSACGAGKTTTSTGTIGSDYCHYGSETQLCDSAGCVNLSDPESWTDL